MELEEEVKPFGAAFDLLSDHVVITDPSGNIIYANQAVSQKTGFAHDEIIGRNPADLWGGKMDKIFYERMWQTIKIEKKPFSAEVKNIKKDGREYWQEIFITPILDEKQEVKFFIAIEPDITEKKKAEEFRTEFVSMVGHQLRNPLALILWTMQSFMRSGKFSEGDKSELDRIYQQNRQLYFLVRDLLVLANIEKNLKSSVEPVDLVLEIKNIIKAVSLPNPNVQLSFEKDQESYPLSVNKSLTQQVFSNIIYNAAEYSDKDQPKVHITLSKTSDSYLFVCNNNGNEIPLEDQPKIFGKFFRSQKAIESKENGTGLGLFIVKTIVDSLGWKIWFESASGRGTTFYVKIPIVFDKQP